MSAIESEQEDHPTASGGTTRSCQETYEECGESEEGRFQRYL